MFYCVVADYHCSNGEGKRYGFEDQDCSKCNRAEKNEKKIALRVLSELVKTKQIPN
jgi:hypothetical protein